MYHIQLQDFYESFEKNFQKNIFFNEINYFAKLKGILFEKYKNNGYKYGTEFSKLKDIQKKIIVWLIKIKMTNIKISGILFRNKQIYLLRIYLLSFNNLIN